MVGITVGPRILILDGFDILWCRVSCVSRSRELRSSQVGPSERCSLRWVINYFMPELLVDA